MSSSQFFWPKKTSQKQPTRKFASSWPNDPTLALRQVVLLEVVPMAAWGSPVPSAPGRPLHRWRGAARNVRKATRPCGWRLDAKWLWCWKIFEIAGWFGLICWNVMYLFFLKSHVMFLIFYFSVTESIGGNEALLVVVPLVIACDSGFVSIKVMWCCFRWERGLFLVVCFSSNSHLFRGEQETVLWGHLGDTENDLSNLVEPNQPIVWRVIHLRDQQKNNQIPGHQDLTYYESPKFGTFFLPG